jgi:hypothetical protein
MDERRGRRAVDADPQDGQDGRNESEAERMDRNWDEILQEMRVTQTGTQILSGFLLAIAFQPRFVDLTDFQRTVYLILVITAAATTALALAPVSMHRGLFRQHLKKQLVQTGHVILRCTLVGVAMVLVGTILLIFDVAVGLRPAAWAAAGMLVLIIGIGLLPVFVGRSSSARQAGPR